VIIYGSGFEDPLQVFLGNELMELISVSGTELVVKIPDDLGTQCAPTPGSFRVVLLESGLEASGGNFTIQGNRPTVLSVSPIILQELEFGDVSPDDVTIIGQQFSEEVLVSVGQYVMPSADVDRVSESAIDVQNIPDTGLLGVNWTTTGCVTDDGYDGTVIAPTSVSVTVTNFPGNCPNTLEGAIVIEPYIDPLLPDACVPSPDITATLSSSNFGDITAGSCSTPATLTISNNVPGATLNINQVTIDSLYFFNAPNGIQAFGGVQFVGVVGNVWDVYFCPDSVDTFSGVLTILSDDPNEPEIRINVSGNGV